MGFLKENLDVLNVANIPSSPRGVDPCIIISEVNSPNNVNRAPLQDMTNGPIAKAFKSITGSWKKKARAQENGPGVPSSFLAEKRHSDAMLIDFDVKTTSRPKKVQRISPMENLSAMARPQPRQDQ